MTPPLVVEGEEKLESLDVTERVEWKIWLKTNIMASGPITSWQIDEETVETVTDFIFLDSRIKQVVIAAMKLKGTYSLERKLWPT